MSSDLLNTFDIWNSDNNERKKYIAVETPEKYVLTQRAKAPVEFSFANILDDVETLDFNSPALLMCRNMWPYIKQEEYEQFANTLYQRLPIGSIVVLGDFDNDSPLIMKELSKAGFEHPKNNINYACRNLDYIWEKN